MSMLTPIGEMNTIAEMTRDELERTCRQHAFSSYIGNHVSLCRILSRLKIFVDTRDTAVAPYLMLDGIWETCVSQLMAKIIQPGFVCIDVGANLGYFSLLMSELCHAGLSGIAVAVEPNPPVCQLLRLSEAVHTRRFKVVEKAVTNYTGDATLTIPGLSAFAAATIKPNALAPGWQQTKVATSTLDDLVLELKLPKVDVIKIDVEGEEPAVFEGMEKTLENNPHVQIIAEYSPAIYYEKAQSFTDYLMDRFQVDVIGENGATQRLDEVAVRNLIQIKNHVDLYLIQKM
ncbi:MAG: FkbM family methyltransferase [Burkholderiales bacterium]|nr:FkbM family methyltransferase [Burkholderiales bacterium]